MNISRKPPRATLAALQWAADRAGLSYGRFMLGLTVRDELRIQEEYEEWRGQTIPLQKRLVDSEAVGSDAGSADNEAAGADSNTGTADSNTAGSVFGEQRREGMEDDVSGSAQTTPPSDLFDIHTLRTLLDRLPDEVDEEYYQHKLTENAHLTNEMICSFQGTGRGRSGLVRDAPTRGGTLRRGEGTLRPGE